MSRAPASVRPVTLFTRARVTPVDERVFLVKLAVLAVLTAGGAALALRPEPVAIAAGVILLGAMFTHAVELQHQCLHHSAFRRALPHRLVGIPLGIPLMVVYSHYRVRHLQHHRYLGTPQDTEFFGFDTRGPLTVPALLRGLFDYPRLGSVVREVARSVTGRWSYPYGHVAPAMRRRIVVEYTILGGVLLAAAGLVAAGYGEYVLRLWALPLLLAVPMHFLVELPEHILCDTETTDVLRNTRSIRGSWLSTWYTNGNNLHIEHHAAMAVPINRLPERHGETRDFGLHVERTYLDFYRLLWNAVGSKGGRGGTGRDGTGLELTATELTATELTASAPAQP
ncbi:fatty acid desaturase family protein [Streptomyces sp. AK02-01A]|uniref:fatty acid desaturase family protein n=1 Tax=Streptomyces sp. AK02-01A TaxID=3028648 RepID=UPI0029A473C9|nr:fatty acid desaturase [Streptomyces sp. AK02-01A]MDX3855195.1 fatty acid desaturase [Streptomyces sp. AK02-01A]